MLEAMARVIIRPGEFFTQLSDNPRLGAGAVWVVLLVAVITTIVGYVSALPTVDAMGDAVPFGGATLIFGLVAAPLLTFLSWAVNGLLARIGTGMAARPWAVVGYAMTPQIVLSTLLLVIAALFPPTLTPIVAAASPEALQEALTRMTAEMQASFLGMSLTVSGYLSLGWFLALTYLGLVKTASQPSRALLSVALIGILNFAVLVLPWLFAPL